MNFKELYAEQKNVIWTVLILAVLVVGFLTIAPQVFHASSSVNGRNLPIYCVETDEKKVALSFDAACASCCLRKYGMYSPVYMGSRNVLRLDSLFLQVLTVNA